MEYNYSSDVLFSYIFIGVIGVTLLIAIPFYLMYAIGLKTIADRRNLKHSVFAFFPFLGSYLLGCVYDDIQAFKGKKTKYRKLLLAFGICTAIPMMLYFVFSIALALSSSTEQMLHPSLYEPNAGLMVLFVMLMVISYIIGLGFGIAYAVFYSIALYNIYNEYDRKNAVLYLVLSIIFGLSWLFLFLIRNKEPEPFIPQPYAPPYGYPQPPYGYAPPPVSGPMGPGAYPPPGVPPQAPIYGRPPYPQAPMQSPYPGYPQPSMSPPTAPPSASTPQTVPPMPAEASGEEPPQKNDTGEELKDV